MRIVESPWLLRIEQKNLSELTLAQLQQFSSETTPETCLRFDPRGSVKARNHYVGTAPDQVRAAVAIVERNSNSLITKRLLGKPKAAVFILSSKRA